MVDSRRVLLCAVAPTLQPLAPRMLSPSPLPQAPMQSLSPTPVPHPTPSPSTPTPALATPTPAAPTLMPSPAAPTPAPAPVPATPAPPPLGPVCGNGVNGTCTDPTQCCSVYGYCSSDCAHCCTYYLSGPYSASLLLVKACNAVACGIAIHVKWARSDRRGHQSISSYSIHFLRMAGMVR